MVYFNEKQRRMIREISKSNIGLTIYDASKRAGISWITAKKYMTIFLDKNIVILNNISKDYNFISKKYYQINKSIFKE